MAGSGAQEKLTPEIDCFRYAPHCGPCSVQRRRLVSRRAESPQFGNLRVGPQLPLHIVTAGPEDDASGAASLELDETFAQLLASACEGHLFGGGYINEG